MQGAVLRASGSARMLSVGMSGICSLTILMYFSFVTTHIFSTGQIGFNLSTVSCMSERPTPITSINCLGYSGVDIGHKRLPMPPAMIMICISLQLFIFLSLSYIFRIDRIFLIRIESLDLTIESNNHKKWYLGKMNSFFQTNFFIIVYCIQ